MERVLAPALAPVQAPDSYAAPRALRIGCQYACVGVNGDDRPERKRQPEFRSRGWRAGNAVVSVLARAGIGPIHLLTTRGYKSGRPYTVPAVPVDHDGKRW